MKLNVYVTFDKKISRYSLPIITPFTIEQFKEQVRNAVLLGSEQDPSSKDYYLVGFYDDLVGKLTYQEEADFVCNAGEFKNE